MASTPKIIGLMSCGFLLCLGLSNPAPAAEGEKAGKPHTRQPGGPRVGGQSGQPSEGRVLEGQALEEEAGKPHMRQPGGPRVGGQSGQPSMGRTLEGEAGKPHTRQPGGPRVGGQSGQ